MCIRPVESYSYVCPENPFHKKIVMWGTFSKMKVLDLIPLKKLFCYWKKWSQIYSAFYWSLCIKNKQHAKRLGFSKSPWYFFLKLFMKYQKKSRISLQDLAVVLWISPANDYLKLFIFPYLSLTLSHSPWPSVWSNNYSLCQRRLSKMALIFLC